jgi:hypothetical protein
VRLAIIVVLFLAACSESDLGKRSFELCHESGGQMMLFTPTQDITAYELATLLSELRWGLGPVCVKPDNHVPEIVAKYFRPDDRH